MNVLVAHELYRFFHRGDDEVAALRGVDLVLSAGEFVALRGPSGSGKSTLLACLAGLDDPDGGTVDVLGQRITRRPEAERARIRARHIGVLMQTGNLFDHLRLRDQMRLQCGLSDRPSAGADAILDGLGLATLADALPRELSGGEAARAGLAVAMAQQAEILLCDEPTGQVDAETERLVLRRLSDLCAGGTAVLVATHSEAVSRRADRILPLSDGRIVHVQR
ncbi:ABC transporter ATP-binding protein [Kaistia sp. 32K]|uniref:ABC transporter ATP-binding protein n=1 Tax=Kaistia sp. 32K TaxID=2795690 RepID=UPI0019161E4F|nr:ATP-binding cassette domain-containing protein [Kaistia sp. 32K]BCP54868.1 ABC transporter ATP-binding protein [Kaistia sp. 32K]